MVDPSSNINSDIGGMMNFTKEYIKECDCKEIQGLREELETGDKVSSLESVRVITTGFNRKGGIWYNLVKSKKDKFSYRSSFRENIVWLPNGDQLDDEIVKTCKEVDYEYLLRHTSWRKATSSLGKSILIRGDYIWCLEIWNALDKIIAK